MGIFGASKYAAVPLGAALVWYVIVRGSYRPVERILILFSFVCIWPIRFRVFSLTRTGTRPWSGP
jgi:hypothetical protein